MNERYSNILVEFFERMSSWEHSIVAEREISLAQMHLLEVVGNHQPMRMKELSSKLGVTTGTLTVMVNRLVSNGYLVKEKDAEDNRSSFVRLTSAGVREYDHHHHLHGELIDEIVENLGDDRAETFFTTLEEIQELM